jgi:predicted urease superfamily metal-dependent hydrolase
MVSRVGYFEGTDPILLTRLAAEGIETLPVANTWDHHGKYVNHLCKDEVDVVVGYLHKVIPAEPVRTAMVSVVLRDMFSACKTHDIPVLLIVPSNLRNKAKKIVGNTGANIQFVAPEELEAQIRRYL